MHIRLPRAGRTAGRAAAVVLAAAVAVGVVAPPVQARPERGPVGWAVLLCRTADDQSAVQSREHYEDMFVRRGTGGLADYWHDVSYGGISLDGSSVNGWFRMPTTTSQEQAASRSERYQHCLDAAAAAGTRPASGVRTLVLTSPGIDMFGFSGGAYLPKDVDVLGAAHEMGHGLGMIHSFSDDPTYRNADWAQVGEYDDQWDLMSAANVWGTPTARFGNGGPGLNAYHLDRMGWVSRDRISVHGADGARSRTVRLAALNHPEAPGSMIVRVPFDASNLYRHYTVELRTKDGWDAGIPRSTVLVHEVKWNETSRGYHSYLLRSRTGARDPLQSVSANGVTISVGSVDEASKTALVTITGGLGGRCVQGYVWRGARASDTVCVTPGVRAQTQHDNSQAAARRQPGGGAYGRDTCRRGYVWREAFPGDRVCVTPERRRQARADNAASPGRTNPARLATGPNTCAAGYVWREADRRDYVCVTGAVRQATREDNARAAERRQPGGGAFGPDTCRPGFVWRDAFLGDRVCVTGTTRSQARADNAAAQSRLAQPNG